jgi:tRNA U34 5-methylaminomethyl-2-thiouridine-forming methyltransferase MnmC
MDSQIIMTEDGSPTVFSEHFKATYHSRFGAIQESNHVFIDAGLKHLIARGYNKIKILELGFGTGLNVLLTALTALENRVEVTFTSLDAYPLEQESVEGLNYCNVLDTKDCEELFKYIHALPWNANGKILPIFELTKVHTKFEEFASLAQFDLIYMDAFAPTVQPEFWESPFVDRLFNLTSEGGNLVSYCAKGSFKRALKSAGYQVEMLAGPPGKREMTRAIKPKD